MHKMLSKGALPKQDSFKRDVPTRLKSSNGEEVLSSHTSEDRVLECGCETWAPSSILITRLKTRLSLCFCEALHRGSCYHVVVKSGVLQTSRLVEFLHILAV